MKHRVLLLLTTALVASSAHARMYQWISPDTGSVQLSGVAPAWYRGDRNGPRVFVFEDGRLIDDTAVAVPDHQLERLRAAAFGDTGGDAEPAADRQMADLRQALEEAAEGGIDVTAVTEAFSAEQAAAAQEAEDSSVADTVAELKALLEAWDETRAGEARSLLERATLPAAPVPTPSY